MQVNPKSAFPATALAIATLLPGALPRRRLIGAALVAGGLGAQFALDPDGAKLMTVSMTGTDRLNSRQEKLAGMVASCLVDGLLSIPVVGAARLLPVRRIFSAAALAGGYLALDAKLAELGDAARRRVRSRHQTDRPDDGWHHADAAAG